MYTIIIIQHANKFDLPIVFEVIKKYFLYCFYCSDYRSCFLFENAYANTITNGPQLIKIIFFSYYYIASVLRSSQVLQTVISIIIFSSIYYDCDYIMIER